MTRKKVARLVCVDGVVVRFRCRGWLVNGAEGCHRRRGIVDADDAASMFYIDMAHPLRRTLIKFDRQACGLLRH